MQKIKSSYSNIFLQSTQPISHTHTHTHTRARARARTRTKRDTFLE